MESHLLQMRGLKHQKMIAQRQHDVASFTDASSIVLLLMSYLI